MFTIKKDVSIDNLSQEVDAEDANSDELYEQWWSEEGESHFEEYLNTKSNE